MTGSQISHAPPDAAEMPQIKDTGFKLVRPNFAHLQGTTGTSEDSGVLGREGSIDLRQDGYLLPESPTVSTHPTCGLSHPTGPLCARCVFAALWKKESDCVKGC